jgi:DNA-binding CsgD family transcriptional regulator
MNEFETDLSDRAPDSVFVALCDWRGRVTWSSRTSPYAAIGDFAWVNLDHESQQEAMSLFSRVVTLRETRSIEVTNLQGVRLRGWLWPLDSPEVAVCMLIMQIPAELGRLTKREKECLALLARGPRPATSRNRSNVSLSTVHTYLKRSREKLGLPNVEALIGFAARYCFPPQDSLSASRPDD